jgi:DNA polymerase II large subunit
LETNRERYVSELKQKIEYAYSVAGKARSQGKDPDKIVEALPAGDLAARVEGLVGPPGIAERIRTVGRENLKDIIREIIANLSSATKEEKEEAIDQALRTSLAIITEGVVAAPIEGISRVAIKSNPDGTEYLSVYFSGPIRSAGGTAQGMAVVIADFIRKDLGLKEYRPIGDEVERFVEEIRTYHNRVTNLQYIPPEDDIRTIARNVTVCVDGDPTEEREVAVHRDLKRVETNRIRGGMCLVIAEGIAQKAKKIIKNAAALDLDWSWLKEIETVKGKKINPDEKDEYKPMKGVMAEVVGGRPIFSTPGMKGGFRLRYGRARSCGIAAKSIHPATVILLDEFIATGTQLKIEKPGKGCVATVCASIEPPVVKLKNGNVLRIESVEKAKEILLDVEEVLFLGDILVSYGDFLQTNTQLLPAGYCSEWWTAELNAKGIQRTDRISAQEAVRLSKEDNVPLHPAYCYHWEDLSAEEAGKLISWIASGSQIESGYVIENNSPDIKRFLELICLPHEVAENKVLIRESVPMLAVLGADGEGRINLENINEKIKALPEKATGFDLVKTISPIPVRPKVGTYIGARMGRPEKAKERKMEPPVHALFPIGFSGGKERSIGAAAEKGSISVDIARYECPNCKTSLSTNKCPDCGTEAIVKRICPKCNSITVKETCPRCNVDTKYSEQRDINIRELWKNAIETLGTGGLEVKGVQGMISEYKIPEPIEKGILRAKHRVFVFKDGTLRFDSTDVPLTHFKPSEVDVSIEKLKSIGYEKDYLGNELTQEKQVLELKVQDIILPGNAIEYFIRATKFIDELLVKFYRLDAFYNVETKEDLLGHLVVGLAPHTSAGTIGRIVGFNNANVGFAHPFFHAAKRRNCDGDEDALLLLMDSLLNFSKKYLPERRGGKMDAPLVISTIMDPKEVDDEAHKMEISDHYPLELYEGSWQQKNPSEIKVQTVASLLDNNPFEGIRYSHETENITGPVLQSRYTRLTTMEDKVNAQLKVAEKIRAVDEREVAEIIINSHFLRDTYGNLRAFSCQKFRCVKCNESYRRVPLSGKCTKCGGKLLLTVSEGTIKKYLDISIAISDKYQSADYLRQRLQMLKKDIDSLFINDLSKQMGLSDFM